MKILIDVDGVMLNTQEALLNRLNNRYDTRYTLENVTHYHWFENVYKNINPWAELEDYTFWHDEVSLIDGAKNAFDWLNREHEVYFVTASNVFNPAFAEKMICLKRNLDVSTDWLNNHIVITQHKELVQGDVLIDDCAENVYKWIVASSPRKFGLLFGQPWNKDNEYNLYPYASWSEIENTLYRLSEIENTLYHLK